MVGRAWLFSNNQPQKSTKGTKWLSDLSFCASLSPSGSRITVGFVQLTEMVGHRGVAQQLGHAVVMFMRGLQEETPELTALRVEHAERECDAQKCFYRFEAVILVRFRHVLRHCAATIRARGDSIRSACKSCA